MHTCADPFSQTRLQIARLKPSLHIEIAMKNVVWGLVILLIILHQDFWYWETDTSVMGFIPIGLFYHALISIAASATWYLATIFAWPEGMENIIPEDEKAGESEVSE